MTILLFVSYKFRNSGTSFSQCYLTNVWVLESPDDFPRRMQELASGLKQFHDTDVVIVENITMQKWETTLTNGK